MDNQEDQIWANIETLLEKAIRELNARPAIEGTPAVGVLRGALRPGAVPAAMRPYAEHVLAFQRHVSDLERKALVDELEAFLGFVQDRGNLP